MIHSIDILDENVHSLFLEGLEALAAPASLFVPLALAVPVVLEPLVVLEFPEHLEALLYNHNIFYSPNYDLSFFFHHNLCT
jgi:hypothetical protein